MPSYSYKLFLYLYLNNEEIYTSCQNSKGVYKNKISKKELEFCLFNTFSKPSLNFRHAYNHENGQKRFGKYFVDLFSPVSKEVYNFQGCYFHSHGKSCRFKGQKDLPEEKFNEARAKEKDMQFYLKTKFKEEIDQVHFVLSVTGIFLRNLKNIVHFQKNINLN